MVLRDHLIFDFYVVRFLTLENGPDIQPVLVNDINFLKESRNLQEPILVPNNGGDYLK